MTDFSHLSKDQQAVIRQDKGYDAYDRVMRARDMALADSSWLWVPHVASGCGDRVRVLMKGGKAVWWPTRCACGGTILTSNDLDLSTGEPE